MLDGGAMFGVVPKSLWSRHMTADANNLCSGQRGVCWLKTGQLLVDTGIGSKQSEKFFSHYHLHGEDYLIGLCRARIFEG